MKNSTSLPRRLGATTLALGGLAMILAACGDGGTADPSATTVTIRPTSYVTLEPASTTTTLADSETPAGGTSKGEQTYKVKAGDYPLKVATMYGITVDELVAYNEWGSANDFPYPGSELKIPPGAKIPGAEEPDETPTTDGGDSEPPGETSSTIAGGGDNCGEGSYTVAEGDYPLLVAENFDVEVADLAALNGWTPPDYLDFPYPGTKIKIPAKSEC